MAGEANPAAPQEVFLVVHGSLEAVRALGYQALDAGLGVTFYGEGLADPFEKGKEVDPAQIEMPECSATARSFVEVAQRLGKKPDIGTRAWYAVVAAFRDAHNAGEALPVRFALHPPLDVQWDQSAPIDFLDVASLAPHVERLTALIRGQAPHKARALLLNEMPPNASVGILNFWDQVVQQLLAPKDTET